MKGQIRHCSFGWQYATSPSPWLCSLAMGSEGLRQAYDMEPPCIVHDSECLSRTDREKATTSFLLSGPCGGRTGAVEISHVRMLPLETNT